jgi:hypothetical protein
MLLTILSSLFGVASAVLPNLVKIMETKQDNRHEIELTKLKMEAASKGLELTAISEGAKADAAEGDSVRQHDSAIHTTGFLEGLRASIRPVVTYCFFFMFCGVKIAIVYVMLQKGYNPNEIINAVWDQNTMAIFAAIIGFWFGSRSMTKLTEMYNIKVSQQGSSIPSNQIQVKKGK